MSLPRTLYGAWLVLRANQLWAPEDNDPDGARRCMERFYTLIRDAYGEPRDVATAARLEVDWWRVHREHQQGPDGTDPLVEAVTRLYAFLYGEPEAAVRPAAAQRVLAMDLSDQWVAEGCVPGSPLLAQEHAALVRSLRCPAGCGASLSRWPGRPSGPAPAPGAAGDGPRPPVVHRHGRAPPPAGRMARKGALGQLRAVVHLARFGGAAQAHEPLLGRDEQRHHGDHIVPALLDAGDPGRFLLSQLVRPGLEPLCLLLPGADFPAHQVPRPGHGQGGPYRGDAPACYRPREAPDQGQQDVIRSPAWAGISAAASRPDARFPRKERPGNPCMVRAALYCGSCHYSLSS